MSFTPTSFIDVGGATATELEGVLSGDDKKRGELASDVFDFSSQIRDCTTLEDCRSLFRDAIARHGFDSFACGELDVDERSRSVFYIVDWPPRLYEFYVNAGYINHDPLLDELKRSSGPYTWTELFRDKTLSKPAKTLLERVYQEGWTEGLVVPFRRSETRFGLVSLVGTRDPLQQDQKNALSMMAICLHQQARRLGPGLGVALALSALSLRELDCLRLVAQGQSDKDIAETLGIAQSTAHEHVEAAKRKLKASNRAEAAAVGVSLGLS